MQRDIARVLIDHETIARRVGELGRAISGDLTKAVRLEKGPDATPEDASIVLIPILTGSMVFVADLIRELPIKLRIQVVAVSSYPGKSMESKGVAIKSALPDDLTGAHVLLVDDILDSGHTMNIVSRLIKDLRPASFHTCVLLRKPGKAKVNLTPDYIGFDIPDEFVVGYGLDYDGFYRNYPAIAVLRGSAT